MQLVDQLEQRGLVERRRLEWDRRTQVLHLRPGATEALQQARARGDEAMAERLGTLGVREIKRLVLLLQRFVIIIGTAFGGAWTALVGGLALVGDRAAQAAASANNVWVVYPLDPAPGKEWVLWVWLGLGLAGTVSQLGQGKRPRIVKAKKSRK